MLTGRREAMVRSESRKAWHRRAPLDFLQEVLGQHDLRECVQRCGVVGMADDAERRDT